MKNGNHTQNTFNLFIYFTMAFINKRKIKNSQERLETTKNHLNRLNKMEFTLK